MGKYVETLSAPALLDKTGLAKRLSVSKATIERLMNRGLPVIRIGDKPLFELETAIDWLKAGGGRR